MAIRSNDDKRYSRRFIIMGAVICGFSLWCLYDGLVKYPREQARGLAFDKLSSEGREKEWDEYAIERGWSNSIPEQPKPEEEYHSSLYMQYSMAVITALIGVPMLVMALRSRGTWVESTDDGITSSWGQGFDFDQVLLVDKKRWQKKGIAKVYYQDADQKRRFVLDDFKFERPTMDQILYELEQRIDPDKIINGPPEPPPGEADEYNDAHEIDEEVAEEQTNNSA